MKRFFLLIALLLLVLIGCNNENTPTTTTNDSITTTTKEDITTTKEETTTTKGNITTTKEEITTTKEIVTTTEEVLTTTKEDITTTKEDITTTKEKVFLVSFDSDGGTEIESQYVEKGSNITRPKDPTKVGYTFEGWYVGDEKWSFINNTVTVNLELTAHWSINQYTLEIKYNDGTTDDLILIYDYNAKIDKIDVPDRIDYSFDKWDKQIPELMPAENIVINASWKVKQFALTIKYNDCVTEDSVYLYKYNQAINEIDIPSRLGYIFDKWDKDIPINMPAEDVEINANWICKIKYEINDNEVIIKGLNVNETDIVVLDNYDGFVTKKIGDYAFSGCSSLKSITIPDSVTSIGNYAFYGCSHLTSITIPDSVTSIGNNAFYTCSSLESMEIPNGVLLIGDYVFYNCSSLKSITIPDSVTSIGNYAFYGCSHLTSITIPGSVTSIGENSFNNCSGLEFIVMPDSITSLKKSVFANCSNISYVFYGGTNDKLNVSDFTSRYSFILEYESNTTSLSYIDNNDFSYYMTNDKKILDFSIKDKGVVSFDSEDIFPECKILSFSDKAFYDCSSLTSITIPNSVKLIGEYAFSGCSSLTSITIPNSVTLIESNLFYRCLSLTSITIPNSVTSISGGAFYKCSSLTSITIPNSVTSIGRYAFEDCSSLTSITIPNSVTSIGNSAFSGCSSLISIALPFTGDKLHSPSDSYQYPFGYIFGESSYTGGVSTVQYYYGSSKSVTTKTTYYIPFSLKEVELTSSSHILYGAFYNCNNIVSITTPDGVTSIGENAFYNCTSLSSVIIKSGITSIEKNAFYGCSLLKTAGQLGSKCNIEFGWTTLIPNYAFYDCSSLISVTIPNGVTSIGDYAFDGCSRLSSITIPDNVTSIGNYAFRDCSSLTSITIPNSVTSISDYIFNRCSRLSSITIPDNVTSIGDYAFDGCTNLSSIAIPNGVTSIGNYVFRNCSSLTSITIPDSVTSIGSGALENCSNLTSITLPFIGDGTSENKHFGYIFGAKYYSNNASKVPAKLKNVIILDGCTTIGDYAFYGCASLTSITIPNSASSIDSYAFYNCSSLSSISIGNGVKTIGNRAFENCSSLIKVNVASIESWCNIRFGNAMSPGLDYANPLYIAHYLYLNNELVEDLVIPNGVISISSYAFRYCFVKSITIPNSVTSIGFFAFGSAYLESITLPFIGDGTETNSHFGYIFGAETYSDNSKKVPAKLKNVIILDGCTTIDAYAFCQCSNIESIKIPDSVTSIERSAFSSCSSLTTIVISNKVVSVGYLTFYGCSSLTIYCEVETTPTKWNPQWNPDNRPVVWNYKIEE